MDGNIWAGGGTGPGAAGLSGLVIPGAAFRWRDAAGGTLKEYTLFTFSLLPLPVPLPYSCYPVTLTLISSFRSFSRFNFSSSSALFVAFCTLLAVFDSKFFENLIAFFF